MRRNRADTSAAFSEFGNFAAPRLQVAHYGAHVFFWDHHFDFHHRFE